MNFSPRWTRRDFLRTLGGLLAAGGLPAGSLAGNPGPLLTRRIPSSGEALPVIGLGSSRTFNVGDDEPARANCAAVIRHFFAGGGSLIDSSPMYGTSQDVIGDCLGRLDAREKVFSADKVWISDAADGPAQMQQSARRWRLPRFDLMQVHNLVTWPEHLDTLRRMQADGELRYIGITTSHGRRHAEFERVMREQQLDFVQFSYNIIDREAERRLLPLAAERGIAVIINRPFQRGALVDRLQAYPLPGWAAEIDCANWPQFLLKFIVSHPAVTCAIPATSQVAHVIENMGAGFGALPDAQLRRRMIAYVENL